MRFAVLPKLDATLPTETPVVKAVVEKLESKPGAEWSFGNVESALKDMFDPMTVRKAIWYLSSLGKVFFTEAMNFRLRT
jgi:hypothetical protein